MAFEVTRSSIYFNLSLAVLSFIHSADPAFPPSLVLLVTLFSPLCYSQLPTPLCAL